MVVVAESNDPVRISFLLALLRDAGLRPMLFDSNMAAVLGGAAAIPQRIVVPPEQVFQARNVLREAADL